MNWGVLKLDEPSKEHSPCGSPERICVCGDPERKSGGLLSVWMRRAEQWDHGLREDGHQPELPGWGGGGKSAT